MCVCVRACVCGSHLDFSILHTIARTPCTHMHARTHTHTAGTHGHMKCVFGSQLKAQDTVLMCLYKRVFPKWTYSLDVDTPDGWGTGSKEDGSVQHEQEVGEEEAVMKELFD